MDRFEDLEPGEDEFPLGPHPLAFVAVLAVVLLLAYAFTNVFFQRVGATSIEAGPRLVQLPEVVGLEEDEALAELEPLGFTVEVDRIPNADVPAGQVIAQAPLAGSRISTDRTVTVSVSAGSGFVSVPDVRGSPLGELDLMLFAHGVAVGEITEQESDLDAGEVVSQDPPGGEVVAVGTAVDVVVSSGPPMIQIPDVSDMDAMEAAELLRGAGFMVVYEDSYSWRVDRGDAIGTDPSDEAPRGSQVTLEISRGPAPPRPTAPPTTQPTTSSTAPGGDGTVEPSQPSPTTTTTSPRSGGSPSDRQGPPDGQGPPDRP